MKYYFIIVFGLVFVLFGHEYGYTVDSPWWTHLTYMWQHANVWHLLLNSLSFFLLFGAVERFYKPVVVAVGIVIVSFVASWLTAYRVPVVGASGMVYVLMGVYVQLLVNGLLRYRRKWDLVLFIVSLSTFIVIGFLKHNSAGLLHVLCLVAGFCFTYIKKRV